VNLHAKLLRDIKKKVDIKNRFFMKFSF